jgi:hypothetical protein
MRLAIAWTLAMTLAGSRLASAQMLPGHRPDSTIVSVNEDSLAQLRDVSDLLRSILGRR